MIELIEDGPFKGLPKNYFKVIYADPAWTFKSRSEKGKGRSAEKHYHCMTLEDIKDLPVWQLAAKDCVLLMWITDPLLYEGKSVMDVWKFQYKTVGFYWVKLNKDGSEYIEENDLNDGERTPGAYFTGMGFWTRANPEQCLLGTTGKPKRKEGGLGVRKLVLGHRREHSRKPDKIIDRIETMLHGPYIELFCRESREGWSSWGNEVGKFNVADMEEDHSDVL